MADNVFDILIRFGLSKEKATEATTELKKLEEQGKRTGKETEKAAEGANAKFKDVKKSVELVSGQLGQVGQVLRYVFNPGIVGAALLAKSIGEVWTSFQTFVGGLGQAARNAASSIGNIKQAMLELDMERVKADVSFQTSMEDFERRSNRKIEVINLEKDAVLQLLDAREKVDLAAAKTDEEKAAVKQRYDSARSGAGEQATAKEIAAREASLNEMAGIAQSRFRQGKADAGGRTPEQVKLALKKMPSELQSLDQQIAEQEKVVESLSAIATPAGMLPYWNDPENYQNQLAAFGTSKDTLNKMRSSRKRIADRQLPLTSADTAYDAALGLQREVDIGREDLSNFRSDSLRKQQNNWHASAIGAGQGAAGDLVSAAAGGADALKAGEKIPKEQAEAIAKATQLLGLAGQSNATILSLLSKMNDSQSAFDASLRQLERRMNTSSRKP